jgi:hypothetical protein
MELRPPGGLVGTTHLNPVPQIANLSPERVTLLAPTLMSRGRSWEGDFGVVDGEPVKEWRLEPRAVERVSYAFDLAAPLRASLGPEIRISVPYRVGSGSIKEVEVRLVRRQ